MSYYFLVIVRIILAPFILIYPAPAILLSLFLDIVDADFAHKIISRIKYQIYDKLIDSWVLFFELILSHLLWPQYNIMMTLLFVWRMIGLSIFLNTKKRKILLVFGNYFENIFFLLFFGTFIEPLNFLIENDLYFYLSLITVIVFKMLQEWFIHIADLSIRENVFGSKRSWKSDRIDRS